MKDNSSRPARSLVPDLLFEDVIDARVREIHPWLDHPRDLPPSAPLHRLTVFLTYACNLRCPFCKTIARSAEELARHPEKKVTYGAPRFERLLAGLGAHALRHLHLTGGEAMLLPALPELLRNARRAGVERTSITSNGALPVARYDAVLDAGLDELRISIGAFDARLGDLRAGKPGAFRATLHTLRALAGRRDRATFLIANAVVGHENQHLLAEIVRFLLDAGVDDVKLIPEVDARGQLGRFAGAARVVEAVAARLEREPSARYPLLRRKLSTVFSPTSVGLDGPRPEGWRCYVPLTERTADGVHYYPCSVYLREKGAPLGRIDEPEDVQRARSAAFVERADCLTDPICRRYCLACTRTFNDAANAARSATAPRASSVEATRERVKRARARARLSPPPRAGFLVVTPAGMAHRERLAAALAEMHVAVEGRRPIASWAEASTVLYTRDLSDARVEAALAFESMWRERYPDQRAERWDIADVSPVAREKHRLRALIGGRVLARPATPLPRFPELVRLEPIHVPDPDRAITEAAWLDAFEGPLTASSSLRAG